MWIFEFWLELFRTNTAPDGFRPPKRDRASEEAQGIVRENHIARFSEATGSLNEFRGLKPSNGQSNSEAT